MTNSPFILVCHPHRSPGFAIPYENEQAFVDCWVNGVLDVRCNCRADNSSTATYDAAIKDVGHDMHHVTRLDSRAEYDDYMATRCHNKAWESVYQAALLLEWVDIENDEETENDDESSPPRDSCMTRNEADALLETWNSQKPELFVLLMRDDSGEWSETAYGETCVSSAEIDMQATVSDLCKNCRDFRGAKFGYSDYPFESPFIVERLYDENVYDEE